MPELSESEPLSKLTGLTKDKTPWPQSISFISSLLKSPSIKVKAKSLWLLATDAEPTVRLAGDR